MFMKHSGLHCNVPIRIYYQSFVGLMRQVGKCFLFSPYSQEEFKFDVVSSLNILNICKHLLKTPSRRFLLQNQ